MCQTLAQNYFARFGWTFGAYVPGRYKVPESRVIHPASRWELAIPQQQNPDSPLTFHFSRLNELWFWWRDLFMRRAVFDSFLAVIAEFYRHSDNDTRRAIDHWNHRNGFTSWRGSSELLSEQARQRTRVQRVGWLSVALRMNAETDFFFALERHRIIEAYIEAHLVEAERQSLRERIAPPLQEPRSALRL